MDAVARAAHSYTNPAMPAAEPRLPAALAALSGVLAVAFGTSGAHLVTDAHAKEWLSLAATFGLAHAAAALAVLALLPGRAGRLSATLMGAGALIFGLTLSAMALGAPHWLGAVTPAGGTLMFAGWVLALARILTWPRAG